MANLTIWAGVGRKSEEKAPIDWPVSQVTISPSTYWVEWGRWHNDEYEFAKIHFFADPDLEMVVMEQESLQKLKSS